MDWLDLLAVQATLKSLLHFLAIVNRAAINIVLHVSFSTLISSGYTPSSGIAGSYGGFIPGF